METIVRLNEDSCWLICCCKPFSSLQINLLIDPWLFGAQTDFHPWFSRQYCSKSVASSIDTLSFHIDAIIVAFPFSDHCHPPTLLGANPEIPVYATKKAFPIITQLTHFKHVYEIPDNNGYIEMIPAAVKLAFIPGAGIKSYLQGSLVLELEDEIILYQPHGNSRPSVVSSFIDQPGKRVMAILQAMDRISLPFFIGGDVTTGYETAFSVIEGLRVARYDGCRLIVSHQVVKQAEGLVAYTMKRFTHELDDISDKWQILTNGGLLLDPLLGSHERLKQQ